MRSEDAKILLGFAPDSVASPSEIKSAYRSKISEAYSVLNSQGESRRRASYSSRVVRHGVARGGGSISMRGVASLPFLLIISAALALAGSTASRAYRRQKEAHPCFNPFLP